jgi:hypothetical protein
MSLKNSSSTSVINFWDEVNGNKLSLFLELGSIALLHTQWIINTAKNDGQVLLCHQKIPPEAFVTISHLRDVAESGMFLVIAISYMWL